MKEKLLWTTIEPVISHSDHINILRRWLIIVGSTSINSATEIQLVASIIVQQLTRQKQPCKRTIRIERDAYAKHNWILWFVRSHNLTICSRTHCINELKANWDEPANCQSRQRPSYSHTAAGDTSSVAPPWAAHSTSSSTPSPPSYRDGSGENPHNIS
jgi:dTDP-4-amino-4,6-dideoxygalactose transaminase